MTQLSQLGFWMFSGALGAVGVAATVGVLDQPPRQTPIAKTALVGEQISSGSPIKKPEGKKLAKLSSKSDAAPKKAPIVTPKVVIPTFGLLRVEEDGSTLIAGHAAPNSKVEIFDGVNIVATTTAASNGDFAALLDKPLSPGDHQLGIRATGNDNKILVSAETGLVSMPIKKDGQLLAMVVKPGEASRLIQKPETAKPAKVVPAKAPKVLAKTVESKPKPEIAKPVEVAKIVPKKPEPEKSKPVEVAKAEPKKTEPPQVAVVKVEKPAVAKAKVEAVKKASVDIVAAPKVEAKQDAKEEVKIASKPVDEKPAVQVKAASVIEPEKPVAKEPATPPAKPIVEKSPENPKPAVKAPTIIVEAVEVDGPRMFIAGAAEPGRRVAIYVDNNFVGFADGSREGRFLLEVERPLAKGEHLVRADIYDAKGAIVAARAEVPLIHEPEEPAVVVAKVEPVIKPVKVEPAEVKAKPKAAPKPEVETKLVAEKIPETASKPVEVAAVEINEKIVEPAKPAKPVEQVAKVVEVKKPVAKVMIEKSPPQKKEKPVEVAIATPVKPDVEKPKKTMTPAKPVEAKVAVEKPVEVMKQAEKKTEIKTVEMKTEPIKKAAPVHKLIVAEPKAPSEIIVASNSSKTAPPRRVLRTGSSVIIRRGDSLWRISYRTYGRGIRYSTIYQANLQQLRSPHRIYPGQILKVPKKKFSEQG